MSLSTVKWGSVIESFCDFNEGPNFIDLTNLHVSDNTSGQIQKSESVSESALMCDVWCIVAFA